MQKEMSEIVLEPYKVLLINNKTRFLEYGEADKLLLPLEASWIFFVKLEKLEVFFPVACMLWETAYNKTLG